MPDEFDPSGKLLGSFDDGDPQTTNLYVGNLSPKVWSIFLKKKIKKNQLGSLLRMIQRTFVNEYSVDMSRLMKIFFYELLEDLGLLPA